ncbi:MAG: transposase [Rhodobacteraceae bacterium]|nr:transposase [Paracoccaceae bacterium]
MRRQFRSHAERRRTDRSGSCDAGGGPAALAEAKRETADLRLQPEWFKRNVSVRRSGKRVSGPPLRQADLFGAAGTDPGPGDGAEAAEPPPVRRRRSGAKRRINAVNGAGIRFSADVPVRTLRMRPKAAAEFSDGEPAGISGHVVHRLVQRPASCEILRIVTPVLRIRETDRFLPAEPPPAVPARSCADVSVPAGLTHRRHQRMKAAGVTLSRQTLTNWTGRAIDLLQPVRDAQWESVPGSRVTAMDGTAPRAGRSGPGKMRNIARQSG